MLYWIGEQNIDKNAYNFLFSETYMTIYLFTMPLENVDHY